MPFISWASLTHGRTRTSPSTPVPTTRRAPRGAGCATTTRLPRPHAGACARDPHRPLPVDKARAGNLVGLHQRGSGRLVADPRRRSSRLLGSASRPASVFGRPSARAVLATRSPRVAASRDRSYSTSRGRPTPLVEDAVPLNGVESSQALTAPRRGSPGLLIRCVDAAHAGRRRRCDRQLSGCSLRLVPRTVRLTCFGRPCSSLPTNTRTSHTPGDRSRIVAMQRRYRGGLTLGRRLGMEPGRDNPERHYLVTKGYPSSFFAITMRWIWLVPS